MTPREEIDLLLRVVTRLAQKQLGEVGFIPFGAVLGSNRDVQLLMPEGWKKDCTRDEVEEYWYAELKKHTAKDGCRVACFCADVGVPMEAGEYVSAVYVHIEHPQAEAANVFYPYRKNSDSHVEFGQPTTVKTDHHVFLNTQDSKPGISEARRQFRLRLRKFGVQSRPLWPSANQRGQHPGVRARRKSHAGHVRPETRNCRRML